MRASSPFLADHHGKASAPKAALNILLVSIALSAVFWVSLSRIGVSFDFGIFSGLEGRLLDGFLMTLALSAVSLVLSTAIGIACAFGQNARILAIRYVCSGYVTFMRGTPLIMQIFLFFYIIGTAWGITNRFIAGVLILSLFEGAYVAEIIRGSFLSVDATQIEAAQSVGFTKRQTLRHVIIPQMMARTLPALAGQFASIIKDSSLLSIIAVIELTQTMREISAANYHLFECYLLLGVLYLCLTLPITFISKRLEKRFDYAS
ncbi:MAG: amino acid ABC transporter permease [Raoultibacter sp.]